jgi:hypothetical protein
MLHYVHNNSNEATPMTKAQHTPGPWQCQDDQGNFLDTDWSADYEGDESTGMETTVPVLAGETTVALIVYQNTNFDDEELEANARLIAAAPELLAALDGLLTQKTFHPGRVESASHLWDAVHEAIAKATAQAA